MGLPTEFKNVTAVTVANVYFDGKVVSHTLQLADGSKKTLGLIYPGTFHFDTGAPEQMDITAGACEVKLSGEGAFKSYEVGSTFHIPGKSSFDIRVSSGTCQYICSFG